MDSVKDKPSNRKQQSNKKWSVFSEKHISHKLLRVCVYIWMCVCAGMCNNNVMECGVEGWVQQAVENAVEQRRDHSRFQAYSNLVYFAAETFPAHPQWLVQHCLMSTETVQTVRDGEPRTSTSTFTHLQSSDPQWFSVALLVQSVRTIGDEEPRTATSTSTQLLSSDRMIYNNYNTNMSVKSLITSKTSNKTIGVNFCLVCMSL